MVISRGRPRCSEALQVEFLRRLKGAQQLGLKVIPWTVNAPADIDRLIGWGVDGIISDYPNRVREAMQKRGMALPPSFPKR